MCYLVGRIAGVLQRTTEQKSTQCARLSRYGYDGLTGRTRCIRLPAGTNILKAICI